MEKTAHANFSLGWRRWATFTSLRDALVVRPFATPDGPLAWYTLNLRTAYQLTRSWAVQAGLENILDRNYRVFASGISAPGRNLFLTVRFER